MTTAAQESVGAELAQPSWADFWRDELAPSPGRFNGMVRVVVAATIVLVTSMTLEVPEVAVSLFIVIFLSMMTSNVTTQNSVVVAIVGILAIFCATLAVAVSLLILDATVDYPGLRLAAMAVAFFLSMFVFRVFKLGQAGWIIAIIVLASQAFVDLFPGPEVTVRAFLWIWMAIVYAAMVAIGVNLLLLPADPEPLLRREAAARLRAVAHALVAPPGTAEARDAAKALAEYARQGPTPLVKLIRLAEIQNSAVAPLRAERMAKVKLLTRVVESAALLAEVSVDRSPQEQARVRSLAAECERYAAAVASIDSGISGLPARHARSDASPSAATPIIDEIERVVRELPIAERPTVDEPAERAFFAPDALTNPAYAQFAVKVTIAAMLCYIFYTAVDWSGIHTCMITCVIVALGSAGATIQKSALRLLGCAIGGGLALVSIVFIIPKITSIAALALLVAAVTAPAAWIAMGSERTAYLGAQLAFTYYLATLQGFGPSADITEFRDRFVGIVLGVLVMTLVFAFVWPERAGDGARRSLAAALRRMAALARESGDARAQRAAAWQSLDEADRLLGLSDFEPDALTAEGREQARRMHSVLDHARPVLLAQGVLAEHRRSARDAGADAVASTAFGRVLAAVLDSVANRVEDDGKIAHSDLRPSLAALKRTAMGSFALDEVALCEILTDRVDALQRAAGAA